MCEPTLNAGLSYDYNVIQEAAARFDCDETDAIVKASDVAGPIFDGLLGRVVIAQ